MQEFKDFSAYIQKMEDCGAHKFGIAKVSRICTASFLAGVVEEDEIY